MFSDTLSTNIQFPTRHHVGSVEHF